MDTPETQPPLQVSDSLTLSNRVRVVITTGTSDEYRALVAFVDGPRTLSLLLTPEQFDALRDYGKGSMSRTVEAYSAVFFDLGHFCANTFAPAINDYDAIAALARGQVQP